MSVTTKTRPDGSHQFPLAAARIEAGAATHAGQVRESNEDVYRIDLEQRVFVVADGMGGRSAGDVAALLAADTVNTFCTDYRDTPCERWPFPAERTLPSAANLLRVGLKVANQKLREESRKDPAWYRMGATIAVVLFEDDTIVTAHAGDVRVYRLRGNSMARLTRDHSIAEEIRWARPDLPADELAALLGRNVITKALGSKPEVEPTVHTDFVSDGDLYLLCSDGLWGSVADAKMAEIVLAHPDPESACFALVDAANAAGAPDNVTALLLRVCR